MRWEKKYFRQIRLSNEEAIKEIEDLEQEEEGQTLTKEKSTCMQELRRLTVKIYKNEEIKWRQRAHYKWFKEGNANTAFFHIIAKTRRRTNTIHVLDRVNFLCDGDPTTRSQPF